MVGSIQELVKDRKKLIEAHKKNNFTDGIRSLLTDLYPDTAHFIYELLQNAEDMRATVVHFKLEEDMIYFEHNGTKRDFNLDDIDAITNIGHNAQKKNDPTSIGKFGVGFKAVFAYTSTPEIHSGEYHFQIKDYFVPEFKKVKKIKTEDRKGIKWTKFIFPFDNPKKPKEIAVKEITKSLTSLNDSSILFLNNIRRIEYILPDKSTSYIERIDKAQPFTQVIYKPINKNEIKTEWLKYAESIEIIDDQKNHKNLNISLAYSLIKEGNKYKIVPIDGKVFIYFPAEKEYSGLRFHINAPFASTVARDSVRDCEDNRKLMKKISKLVTKSIASIKELGLLNVDFFEVLPYENETPYFYGVVFDYLYEHFKRNALLPTKYGSKYVRIDEGLVGPNSISNLFNDNDLKKLSIDNKKWIANASKNSKAEAFIKSMKITEMDYRYFELVFFGDLNLAEAFILGKDFSWLRKFYKLCEEIIENINDIYLFHEKRFKREQFNEKLRTIKFVKSNSMNNYKMFKASDIFILPPNVKVINQSTPIVAKELYTENNKESSEILKFLKFSLGIQEYGQKVEIERLVQKYNDFIDVDDKEYYKDILSIAKYNEENPYNDIGFSKYRLFLGTKDDSIHNTRASEIVLCKPYENQFGNLIFDLYDAWYYKLWNGYISQYNKEELTTFLKFAINCGVINKLKIKECDVRKNPLFFDKLYSNANKTSFERKSDYTIDKIEEMLSKNNINFSKLIWKTLIDYNKNEYATASYSPNKSIQLKTCDSTLFYHLKNNKWVPNKDGKLYKPGNIQVKELHDDFPYDEYKYLLKSLRLGSNKEIETKNKNQLEKELNKIGMIMIPKDEAEAFEKFKKHQMKKIKANNEFEFNEVVDKLNKNKLTGEIDSNVDDAIGNVQRREKAIEETFKNSKRMSPIERKITSKINSCSKEEKIQLYEWYKGSCQICSTTIVGYNQKKHFQAINVFNAQDLPSGMIHTFKTCWNSMSLCPNCAMKYRVCSKDMTKFFEEVDKTRVNDGDYGYIEINLELDERTQKVIYSPKHLVALKTALRILKNNK